MRSPVSLSFTHHIVNRSILIPTHFERETQSTWSEFHRTDEDYLHHDSLAVSNPRHTPTITPTTTPDAAHRSKKVLHTASGIPEAKLWVSSNRASSTAVSPTPLGQSGKASLFMIRARSPPPPLLLLRRRLLLLLMVNTSSSVEMLENHRLMMR